MGIKVRGVSMATNRIYRAYHVIFVPFSLKSANIFS